MLKLYSFLKFDMYDWSELTDNRKKAKVYLTLFWCLLISCTLLTGYLWKAYPFATFNYVSIVLFVLTIIMIPILCVRMFNAVPHAVPRGCVFLPPEIIFVGLSMTYVLLSVMEIFLTTFDNDYSLPMLMQIFDWLQIFLYKFIINLPKTFSGAPIGFISLSVVVLGYIFFMYKKNSKAIKEKGHENK